MNKMISSFLLFSLLYNINDDTTFIIPTYYRKNVEYS